MNKNEIASAFEIDVKELENAEILFYAYEEFCYEGSAFVLLKRGNKLFEVHGYHCSCYGLEGQWSEEECSIESLEHTLNKGTKFEDADLNNALREIIEKFKEPAKEAE